MNAEAAAFLAKAHRAVESSRVLLSAGDADAAISRSYYAMFYAAEAALVVDGKAAKSHRGVLSLFGEAFIMSGRLPRHHGRRLTLAYEMRQFSDYDARGGANPRDAERLIGEAAELVNDVREWIIAHEA